MREARCDRCSHRQLEPLFHRLCLATRTDRVPPTTLV
jgi:hypothetical protein